MRKKTEIKIKNKSEEEIKEIIKNLREEIEYHDELYFEKNTQEISDEIYEDKMKELIELEHKFFHLFTFEENKNSPTQKIHNFKSVQFEKIKHNFPMLSLNKAYSVSEIEKFVNDSKENIKEINEFYIEPKIDGLSIALHYEKGKLVRALTRGNGTEGENIIENILLTKIDFFPRTINYSENIEIRGELYISKKDFIFLNFLIQQKIDEYEEIKENNEYIKQNNITKPLKTLPKLERKNLFLNPRNAAAGIVRKLKNISKIEMESIKGFFYQVIEPLKHNLNSHSEIIDFLKLQGFITNDLGKKVSDAKEINKEIKFIELNRDNLEYEIDGVVIKVNNNLFYEELGSTSKYPKGAIAFKFYDEMVKTKLLDIEYNVGRTGKIAYVAKLKPVLLNGTLVSKAYLHNFVNIINLKIRLNEKVYIKKSGEIIPQVIASVKQFDETNIKILKFCPSCNSELKETEKEQFCINNSCKEKNIKKIIHFFSKQAFDVSTLSKKTIENFYEKGIIKNVIDVFKLKDSIRKLTELDNLEENTKQKTFKMRSTTKLLQAIEESKTIEFSKFIYALGIKNVGIEGSIEIGKRINSIDELLNYDYEKFVDVDKFGEIIIEELKNFFSNSDNIQLLEELKDIDLKFVKKIHKIESNNLENLSFVITGTLSKSRNEIKNIITMHSGILSNSVTSKTSYLIVGDDPGESKIKSAEKNKIKQITEEEFNNMINK